MQNGSFVSEKSQIEKIWLREHTFARILLLLMSQRLLPIECWFEKKVFSQTHYHKLEKFRLLFETDAVFKIQKFVYTIFIQQLCQWIKRKLQNLYGKFLIDHVDVTDGNDHTRLTLKYQLIWFNRLLCRVLTWICDNST